MDPGGGWSKFRYKSWQTTNEIVVTKDIIVRPIVPNILRVGDEIIISAVVQNFTQSNQNFDIGLSFDSGEVESALHQNILLRSNEMEWVYWKVKPTVENDKARLVFSAKAKDNEKLGDVVAQEIPVRPFGFEEKRRKQVIAKKHFRLNYHQIATKKSHA